MKKVEIIGMGTGKTDISSEYLDIIKKADVLAGGNRLLDLFPGHGAARIVMGTPLEDCMAGIKKAADSGKKVVILADGDPLFFGIGKRIVKVFGKKRVLIHPNITTLQAAASRAAIAWEEIRTVSLHGRNDMFPLLRALMFYDRVGLYTDKDSDPAKTADRLYKIGVDTFSMTVFENLGLDDEKITTFSIPDAREKKFSPLNFIIFQRIQRPETEPGLGIEDDLLAHENGLITKKEIRAAGLSMLRIKPEHVVWDLGAGCGSVGIEASFLANKGMVLAVEKDKNRFQMIRENIKRTGAYALKAIHARMPEILESLPVPDRIFIGGGLGHGDAVLKAAANRLKPGGRIVIHAILLKSINLACGFFDNAAWPWTITQVSVSRSGKIAGNLRLNAENPVFIITAHAPKG